MANESEERERQRVRNLVREDLRKELEALLTDVHQESLQYKDYSALAINKTLARFASLLGALYLRAEIQTQRIVQLTKALVYLTFALLLFTAYLSYNAYLNDQRATQAREDRTEKQKPRATPESSLPHG
jgi:hypothetical protein